MKSSFNCVTDFANSGGSFFCFTESMAVSPLGLPDVQDSKQVYLIFFQHDQFKPALWTWMLFSLNGIWFYCVFHHLMSSSKKWASGHANFLFKWISFSAWHLYQVNILTLNRLLCSTTAWSCIQKLNIITSVVFCNLYLSSLNQPSIFLSVQNSFQKHLYLSFHPYITVYENTLKSLLVLCWCLSQVWGRC